MLLNTRTAAVLLLSTFAAACGVSEGSPSEGETTSAMNSPSEWYEAEFRGPCVDSDTSRPDLRAYQVVVANDELRIVEYGLLEDGTRVDSERTIFDVGVLADGSLHSWAHFGLVRRERGGECNEQRCAFWGESTDDETGKRLRGTITLTRTETGLTFERVGPTLTSTCTMTRHSAG